MYTGYDEPSYEHYLSEMYNEYVKQQVAQAEELIPVYVPYAEYMDFNEAATLAFHLDNEAAYALLCDAVECGLLPFEKLN